VRKNVLALLMVLSSAVLPGSLGAQKNAVVVELFGPAVLGSVNYERLMLDHFTARAGIGATPGIFGGGATVSTPVTVSYLAGSGTHRLEVGGGVVMSYLLAPSELEEGQLRANEGFQRLHATGTLAYRWQQAGGFYRIGFTPVLDDDGIQPLFGLSVGVGF
jgi:hypothetical protein